MTTREIEMNLAGLLPDQPMPAGLLYVPREIYLSRGSLIWSPQEPIHRHPKPGMLEGFLRLSDASDSQILSYAQKWGVLGICPHSLPCSHNQYPYGLTDGVRPCLPMLQLPLPADRSRVRFTEPLDAWRRLSRQAGALLNIAAKLNQGKLANWDDWQVIKGEYDPSGGLLDAQDRIEIRTEEDSSSIAVPYMRSIANARRELASELDGWMAIGQVRPRGAWESKTQKWRFSLDAVSSGPNLFGLLALSVTLAIAGTELAVCAACGNSYRPNRRPNPNRRNYCDKCRAQGLPQRDAARFYRARKRGSA